MALGPITRLRFAKAIDSGVAGARHFGKPIEIRRLFIVLPAARRLLERFLAALLLPT
jgi:hypothetical protein